MSNSITKEELKNRIVRDPELILDFIIENNPDAIYKNLRKEGSRVPPGDHERMKAKIKWLLKSGQKDRAFKVLDVPILEDNLPDGYKEILSEMQLLKPLQS